MRRFVYYTLAFLAIYLGSSYAYAQSTSPVTQMSDEPPRIEDGLDGVELPSNVTLGDTLGRGTSSELVDVFRQDDDRESEVTAEDLGCGEFASCIDANPDNGFGGAAIDDAGISDLLDDFRDRDLINDLDSDIDYIVDSCVPIISVTQSQDAQEYRCNSGQMISENTETCLRPLEYEIFGSVDYRCFISVDSDGNETLSEECETLESSGLCERTSQVCSQYTGPVFENNVCRIGPESGSLDKDCLRERIHQLAVFAQYECEFVIDPLTGLEVPSDDCGEVIANNGCNETESGCAQMSSPEFEQEICRIGRSLEYETVSCGSNRVAVADEDYIWTVTRSFEGLVDGEADFVRSEDYLDAQRADCEFGSEICAQAAPQIERELVCQFGTVFNPETSTCVVPKDVTIDTDYLYRGERDFDKDLDQFVFDAALSELNDSPECSLFESECITDFTPDYFDYSCVRGYTEEFDIDSCSGELVPLIDHRFRYSGSEINNGDNTFTRDAVLIAASSSSICRLEDRSCTQEAVPIDNPFSCEVGYEVVEDVFTIVRDRLFTVDTDYVYQGNITYNPSTLTQDNDAFIEHVRSAGSGSGCVLTDDNCVTPSEGVIDTYSCVAGYRQSFETETCSAAFKADGGNSYIYQAQRRFDFNALNFQGQGAWNTLNQAGQCSVSDERCLEQTPERFDRKVCLQGESTSYEDSQIVEDLVVDVDTDYVYPGQRSYSDSTNSYSNSARLVALTNDSSCEAIGQSCIQTGPLTVPYSCESGNNRTVDRQTCSFDRQVTVDADYVYRVSREYDYSANRWGANTDFDTIRTRSGCSRISGPNCTRPAIPQYEEETCRQGYVQQTAERSCTYGFTFDVETDYFYSVRSNYSSGSYVREAFGNTAAALGCTVVSGTRRNSFGQRPYSTYKCSRGTFNSASTATCSINGSANGRNVHTYTVLYFSTTPDIRSSVERFMANRNCPAVPVNPDADTFHCLNYVDPNLVRALGEGSSFVPGGLPFIDPNNPQNGPQIAVDYQLRDDIVNVDSVCSAQRAGRTLVSDTCVEREGLLCKRSELVYRGSSSINYNTCSVPSGFTSVSGSNVNYRRALSNFNQIQRTDFCDQGYYFNPSNGNRVNRTCNMPSGSTVISNTCIARVGNTCTLNRRQYRYNDSGGDIAYLTHFTEEYKCSQSVPGRSPLRTNRKAGAPKALSIPANCRQSPANPPSGCHVKTNTARPRSLTVDGITSNHPSGSWGRDVVYTCETSRTQTNSCPQFAANDNNSVPKVFRASVEAKKTAHIGEIIDFGYPKEALELDSPVNDIVQFAQAGSREIISERCISSFRGQCTLYEYRYREEQPDSSGGCSRQTEDYRCENTSPYGSLVRTEREVISDRFNEAACNGLSSNNSCVLVRTDNDLASGETRTINGLAVTRNHWRRTNVYDCTSLEAVNTCDVPSGAVLSNETCLDQQGGICHRSRFDYDVPRIGLVDGCEVFETEFRCENRSYGAPRREAKEISSERYVPREAAPVGNCESTGVVNSNTESRFVDGLLVTRPFTRRRNFTCSEVTPIDRCEGQRANALNETRRCVRTNREGVCELYEYSFDILLDDPSNGCSLFVDEFKCSSEVTDAGSPVAVPNSFSFEQRSLGECYALNNDETCSLISNRCVEPGGTRIIDGREITRSCWRRVREYECEDRVETDSCDVDPRFSQVSEECLATDRNGDCTLSRFNFEAEGHDPSGGCLLREQRFRCENEQTGFTALEEIRHVTSNRVDPEPVMQLQSEHHSCQFLSNRCIDGAGETRIVDGLEITSSCWTFESSYNCQDRNEFESCDFPSNFVETDRSCISEFNGNCTAELVNGTFETFDNEGQCLKYDETHICDRELDGFDYDERLSRFVSARFDTSACSNISNRGTDCELKATLCLQGPETRIIEGVEVFRECWEQQYDYECRTRESINTCDLPLGAELVSDDDCEFEDRDGICRLTRFDYRAPVENSANGCQTHRDTYRCNDEQPSLTLFNTLNSLERIEDDRSSCDALLSDDAVNCTETSVCIEGPETRIIEGVEVYQECWKSEIEQQCEVGSRVDTCDVPEYATLNNEVCLDDPANDNCQLYERTYDWIERDGSGGCHIFEVPVTCDLANAIGRPPESYSLDIIDSKFDETACNSAIQGQDNCIVTDRVCLDDTPAARMPDSFVGVDGVSFVPNSASEVSVILADCWEEQLTYECENSTPVDDCDILENNQNCSETVNRTCIEEDRNGECSLFEVEFDCAVEGSASCVRRSRTFECPVDDSVLIEASALLNQTKSLGLAPPDFNAASSLSPSLAGFSSDTSLGLPTGFNSAQSANSRQPDSYRVEVVGAGFDNSACEAAASNDNCVVLDEICEEAGVGRQNVRRSQSDFYDQFLSLAPQVDEICWSRRRTYRCEATSRIDVCEGQENNCSLTAENCLLRDDNGLCLISENSYDCQIASCQSSNLTCDERLSNAQFTGHRYRCFTESTFRELEFTPDSNFVDYCAPVRIGCSLSLVDFQTTTTPGFIRGESASIINQREVYDAYCPVERVGGPNVTYLGYVDANSISADSDNCSAYESNEDCNYIDGECFGLGEGEQCTGPRRATYSCLANGEGEACDGECSEGEATYTCSSEVGGAGEPVSSDEPRLVGGFNEEACARVEENSDCEIRSETCTQGPETRVIDGVSIFAECWEFEREYYCQQYEGESSDCEPGPECEKVEDQCLGFSSDGQTCLTYEHVYRCQSEEEREQECEQAEAQEELDDPNNADEEPGASFFDVISALSGVAQAADDANREPEIFAGDKLECGRLVLGVKNCCSRSGILIGLGCNNQETRLQTQRQEDLCISNGTYCSRRAFFGACLRRSQAFCCYSSRVVRTIVEAGMQQLGRDFGSARDTACDGFTVEEFQSLDLSRVDFSGVANDIIDNANLNPGNGLADRLSDSINNLQNNQGR